MIKLMSLQRIFLNGLIIIGLLSPFFTTAQSGDFTLTHHAPKHSEIDNVNFHITADKNGVICIANRFGLLKYDGIEWEFFQTNSSALSLAITDDNTVYVGGIGEFGRMDYVDEKYQYVQLLKDDSIADHFLQSFYLNQTIYFLSDRNLYGYNHDRNEAKHLATGDFLNGYVEDNKLYLNTNGEELLRIQDFEVFNDTPSAILWGIIQPSPDGKRKLAVDLNGDIYSLDGEQPSILQQNKKIREAEIEVSNLAWVNDSLVACSTFESGVFFLNINDPNYFEITDYHSGLPDNEIHDLYVDSNSGVWVAHEFGLTRIAPLFPAYSYTNFPGLEGNLIEAQRIHGDLWVNTSLGVYYFSQDTSFQSKVYRELVQGKTKPVSAKKPTDSDQTASQIQEPPEEDKKKSGFLKGLLRKKNRSESTQVPEKKEGAFKKIFQSKNDVEPEYIRRVERIVTGVSYQFHHVPETDGKFKQLLETSNRILATSHKGIFEITKTGAELVIDEEVKYAFVLHQSDQLLVSTEDGYLKSYELIRDVWQETSQQYFKDVILNVYMDHQDNIWLAGTTHIYRGVFIDGKFVVQGGYEINNRFYDELSIWERNKELFFINSQGYYRFDEEANRIVRDNTLGSELGTPHHHIHNEKSRVWLYNGEIWSLLLPSGEIQKFNYLGVYPDLKYISYDEVLHRYWLVTQDNQLLSYTADSYSDMPENYKLFVRSISGKKGALRIIDQIKLTHDENYLSIELLKLDYLNILNPEYQFKLEGLNQDWSNWTHANLIDFSYIPPGEYNLIVRTRDVFGEIEEASLLNFSVATPYWQTPWFYASQVFILILIISITARLKEEKTSNRIIKSALSILTLVVIIEFLQSVISSYLGFQSTPVVDFLIDAGIAITVFPLEWVLRKLMLEGGFRFMKKRDKKPAV